MIGLTLIICLLSDKLVIGVFAIGAIVFICIGLQVALWLSAQNSRSSKIYSQCQRSVVHGSPPSAICSEPLLNTRVDQAVFYAQRAASNVHLQPAVSNEPLLSGQVDVLRSQPEQELPPSSHLVLFPDPMRSENDAPSWTDVSLDTASVASSHGGSSSVNRGRCCCICLNGLSNCNQGVVETPCRHRFHHQCLREVVNRGPGGERAPCPLCRSIITWKGGDLICTYDDPSL